MIWRNNIFENIKIYFSIKLLTLHCFLKALLVELIHSWFQAIQLLFGYKLKIEFYSFYINLALVKNSCLIVSIIMQNNICIITNHKWDQSLEVNYMIETIVCYELSAHTQTHTIETLFKLIWQSWAWFAFHLNSCPLTWRIE